MSISSRIEATIDGWSIKWGERLGRWLGSVLSGGIEAILDLLGERAAPKLAPLIQTLESTGEIPPELGPIIDELKNPTGEVGALFAQSAGSALVGGAVGKIVDALLLPLAYDLNARAQNTIPALSDTYSLWARGKLEDGALAEFWRANGLSDTNGELLKWLYLSWLNPDALVRLKWRGLMTEEEWFEKMRLVGFTPPEAQRFELSMQFFPSPQDLITWQAREVFEPDSVAKYGLDNEFGELDLSTFKQAGMTTEQVQNYWRAHWEHASFSQVVEMLHRGGLQEQDVWDWFRLVEIPPFWRQKLIDITWNVPTRVDIRRFLDMGTIDETRLRELYGNLGYHDQDLDDYVLWTKVYNALPDLLARFKNGWIGEQDVRNELAGYGMSAERIETLMQTKVQKTAAERTQKERDLTKSDIYRGVKKGIISRSQAVELLMALGYSQDEAVFILDINAPEDKEEAAVKKREITKGDIKSAYMSNTIDQGTAIGRLTTIRYTPTDAEFLTTLWDNLRVVPTEAKPRELAKTDVTKAVKTGVITAEEGYQMLIDLRFEPQDAEFLLTLIVPEETASPSTLSEYQEWVGKARRAQGLNAKIPSPDLKQADVNMREARARVEAARATGATDDDIASLEIELGELEYRYRTLLVSENKGGEPE